MPKAAMTQMNPHNHRPAPGPARAPLPKWKLPKPVNAGLWARTPPALFPALMGVIGLALAWRRGIAAFSLPQGLADLLAGAVALLAAFALLTITVKIARRPAVVAEDLRILPGRAGLAAAVLSAWLLVALIAPVAPVLARGLWVAVGLAHLALIGAFLVALRAGPPEQSGVTPAWHLMLSGPILGALAALAVGWPAVAAAIFWPVLAVAVAIWAASGWQFAHEAPPAPLRPLLAVHLAPLAVFGTVAQGLGMTGLALTLAMLAGVLLAVLAAASRWLLAAGFTPFWGALTFPLVATASLWLAVGWRLAGGLLLVAATLIVVPIAFQVFKMWASGQLAIKTNAAVA
ncbi:tellurium resistance protein [Paracoccus sp. p4-l81]|uniref:SLAC1 family transporter n=1 Tax=Paracoccus sp. p4-l81 TaxID=3342806 RepID=UPI0035B94241